jgi:hypothetical protein
MEVNLAETSLRRKLPCRRIPEAHEMEG